MEWERSRFEGGTPIDLAEVALRRRERPWITEDYWSFLAQVGHGVVYRDGCLCGCFYSGPVTLPSLGLHDGPPGFVAVGDDMAGLLFGFSPLRGDAVLGVYRRSSERSWTLEDQERGFVAFIADCGKGAEHELS